MNCNEKMQTENNIKERKLIYIAMFKAGNTLDKFRLLLFLRI